MLWWRGCLNTNTTILHEWQPCNFAWLGVLQAWVCELDRFVMMMVYSWG